MAKKQNQGQTVDAEPARVVQFARPGKDETLERAALYGGMSTVLAGIPYTVVEAEDFDVDHNSRTITARFLALFDGQYKTL